MDNQNLNVLDEINKGATMGMDAISFISQKVEDNQFKNILKTEYNKYKDISAKINIVFFAYLCASLIFLVFIAIARFSSFFRNLVKPCKTPFVNNKLITNYFFLFIQLNSSITPFLYTLYVYFGKICNNIISSKFIISIFSLLFI